MKSVSISGSQRENVGKKDAKANRNNGLVPCVLYGGKEQKTFVLNEKELLAIINTHEVYLVELNLNDKVFKCFVKEIQAHPVTDKILHIDFLEVSLTKPIVVELPITITGTSPGVLGGGKLQSKLRKLKVKGIYTDLPDYISVDISNLELGSSIKVSQLHQEKIEFLNNPNSVVCMVKLTRGAISAASEVETEVKTTK
ncbi:MAG: 50S ribosomal protein L25/general stress protein Ctc [Bacteroidales bacterium]|nr:50S ribosomal protein L25/general stress protein Ctc [Bacteroidales bacterium]